MLSDREPSSDKNKHLKVLLCRLRLGRTHLMYGYLLSKDVPVCYHCRGFLSGLHTLWLYSELERRRRVFLLELFKTRIPFHPIVILSEDPLVPVKMLLQCHQGADFLRNI